jgi:hypothetical protein
VTCAQTGEELPPGTNHLYVTAVRRTRHYRPDVEHWVFVDEDALDAWISGR